MNAKTWGRWVARLFQQRGRTRRLLSDRRTLTFEYLEDRLVPATLVWQGDVDNLWGTAGNWDLNRAPTTGDELVFGATTGTRNTIDNISNATFARIQIAASGYVLDGSAPKLILSGPLDVGAGVGTVTIDMDLQLAPAAGLQSTITVGPNGSHLVLSGRLSGLSDPQQTLIKAGAGTLEFTNDNTAFIGAITLANNGGILIAAHEKALGGGTGVTTVNPNSQLQLKNLANPITESVILSGTGVAANGALLNLSGNNTWAGNITLDANASIGTATGTTLTIPGLISDLGSGHDLSFVGMLPEVQGGGGRVILNRQGGNTYRGQTFVDNGILTIRDPRSLGAGSIFPSGQSGQVTSGTVVTWNSTTGRAGTLQLDFDATLFTTSNANGILQDPSKPFDPNTNKYIGFQVFNDVLTLNGPGFNGMGALNNLRGDNAWDGEVRLGSLPPSTGDVSIGVAANTNLTISGVVSDPNRTPPRLIKVLPGRLILNNANTYDSDTLVQEGIINVRDSNALGTGAVRVVSGAALELEVDAGLDGTPIRDGAGNLVASHGRNLGFDSVTATGKGQEVYVPGTAGTFSLSFKGVKTGLLNAASTTLEADIRNALNALSTIGGVGGSVTVTQVGRVFRVSFGGTLQNADIPLMIVTDATPSAGATVNAIYGLNIPNALQIEGSGILAPGGQQGTGALHSLTGINEYSGDIALGGTTSVNGATIGVEPDARPGHVTASDAYFEFDHSLTVSGLIDDWFAPILNATDTIINGGHFSELTKVGTGDLILPRANTYSGKTDIMQGWITARNDHSLGTKVASQSATNWAPVTVFNGAALHLKPIAAGAVLPTPPLLYDLNNSYEDSNSTGPDLVPHGGTLDATGYTFGPNQGLSLTNALADAGHYSIEVNFRLDDINGQFDTGWVNLIEFKNGQADTGLYCFNGALQFYNVVTGPTGAIQPGVDYTLLLTRNGATKEVVAYLNGIEQFRFIDTNNLAAFEGASNPQNIINFFIDDQVVPDEAASGHVSQIRVFDGPQADIQTDGITIPNNLVLHGSGITHNYGLINQQGAVENLEGNNYLSGIIKLDGNVGIGVEQVFPAEGIPSQLTLTGYTQDNDGVPGGITKLGSKRLTIQSPGTFTGNVDIQKGVVLVQNDTALGGNTGTVTVESGAALELGNTVTNQTGGLIGGLNIWGEHLILNGTGNAEFGLTPLTVLSENAPGTGPFNNPIVPTDNIWRGPVTVNNDMNLAIGADSRLTFAGVVDDATNPDSNGSDIHLIGDGVVNLTAANTFRGSMLVDSGVLIVSNAQALGGSGNAEVQTLTLTGANNNTRFTLNFNGQTTSPIAYSTNATTAAAAIQSALNALTSTGGQITVAPGSSTGVFTITFGGQLAGFDQPLLTGVVTAAPGTLGVSETTKGAGGTVVADGASMQMAGSFTVANEPLLVNGQGNASTPNVPSQWFQVGPGPISDGDTPGNENVAGRINQTVVDPRDSNIMYVATAGGGVWKTIDGGQTWRPIFESIAEIQSIGVSETLGTFTLSFDGETTDEIDLASPNLAADIQAALNGLANIGGVGGYVTVSQVGNSYRVTFGGTLIGTDVEEITSDAPFINVDTLQQGRNPRFAMYVGSIALDPNDLDTIYVGTGDPNGTTDSYYGTGVYVSRDGGVTWSVLASATGEANPLDGTSISKIVVDAFSGAVYAAASDVITPRNEVQQLQITAPTFTLSFTWPDATGNIVTRTTVPINAGSPTLRLDIENAINALDNVNILGPNNRNVAVTQISGGTFNLTFSKNLAVTNVPMVVANGGRMSVLVEGGASTNNGRAGHAGIWRFQNGTWFNLTAVVSTNRATVQTGAAIAPAQGANPTASASGTANIVGTPGPDDDYRIQFPQTGATWTDLVLIYADTSNDPNFVPIGAPVLYAALGTTPGNGQASPFGPINNPAINNAVFWTQTSESNTPIWYVGDPGGSPYSFPPAQPTGVDARPQGFPRGQFAVPSSNTPEIPLNGNIKIAAVTGGILVNGIDVGVNALDFNKSVLFAAVSTPDGRLRDVYVTDTGGQTWTAITPPNFLYNIGNFSNAIIAIDANTIFMGGQGINSTGAQTIIMGTRNGTTWTFTDVSMDGDGNGPHAGIHSFSRDIEGRLLVSTDGGLWRREDDGTWTNLNGNLAIAQINGVASDPTQTTTAYAGAQSNGTAVYSNDTTWERTDSDSDGGGRVAVDPNNPQTIYAVSHMSGTYAHLRKSINGGTTWTTVLDIGSPTAPLVLDVVNSQRVLVGGALIQESLNGGAIWTNLAAPIRVSDLAIANSQGVFRLDPAFLQVSDIGANAYDADTIYVTDGTSIFVTKNHGQTWVNRTSNLAGLGSIVDIEVDAHNRDTIYAVRSAFGGNQIFRSTDAGLTWIDISSNLPDTPASKVVIDPRNGFLYLGTDNGVFHSTDGGASWSLFGTGMPNVQIRDLDLNLTTNSLLAGTYGRSVFQLFLDDRQTVLDPVSTAIVSLSGTTTWAGPVTLVGDPDTNTVTIGSYGVPNLPNAIPTATLTFSGVISDRVPGSNPTLLKVGSGDVIFSGTNTYGGQTIIQEGAIIVDNSHALGGTGNGTIVEEGAVLKLRSNLELEPVTLNGNGQSFDDHFTGALRNIASANTYTGPLTLNTNTTIGVDSGSQLTIGTAPGVAGTGTISGANSLTKELTGTLVLNSDNPAYTGTTFVNRGALRLQSAGALGTGSGARVLDGARIELQSDPNGTPLVVNQPLTLSGTGIGSESGVGTGALLNIGGNNTWAGPITFEALPGFGPDTFPLGEVRIGVNDGQLNISGPIDETVPTGLTKVGPGELVLSDANTYSGATEVIEGTLDVRHPNALGNRSGTAAVWRVVLISAEQTGALRLEFGGAATTLNWLGSTAPSAAAVQNALNALPTIGGVGGSVTVTQTEIQTMTQNGPGAPGTAFVYTITFGGTLATTTAALLASGQNGSGAAASVVATGGVDVRVANGAMLELDSTDTATPDGFTITGHQLNIAGNGVDGQGALHNAGGSNTWDGPVALIAPFDTSIGAADETSLTLSGGVIGVGQNLTKVDLGTLIFADDPDENTQLLTIIKSGSVQVDGTIGNVQLAGGTLSGTGTVAAISSTGAGGVVNPGDNFPTDTSGTLNAGTATLTPSNTYFVNVSNPGTPTSDVLQLTGNINLGGALLSGTMDPSFLVGNSVTILQTTGTITGSFAGPSVAPVAGGTRATEAFIGSTKVIVDYFADHIVVTRELADVSVTLTGVPKRATPARAVKFTAQITALPAGLGGNATGTVIFRDLTTGKVLNNGNPVPVINGVATLLWNLGGPQKNHRVVAEYSGDDNFRVGTSPAAVIKVVPNGTRTSTVRVISSTNPWVVNSPVTFTATVRDTGAAPKRNPVGTVMFIDTTTGLTLGFAQLAPVAGQPGVMRASFTTSFTTVGIHQIRVRYSGNPAFAVSNSPLLSEDIRVQPTRTSAITIAEPAGQDDPTVFGAPASFTATVTDDQGTLTPGGTVKFYDGAPQANDVNLLGTATLSAGTTPGQAIATFTTTILSVGSHNVVAVYAGNLDFAPGAPSAAEVHSVTKSTSSTTLTSSLNPSKYGQAVTLTATVTGQFPGGVPTGTVQFFDGTTPIGQPVVLDASGVATLVVGSATVPSLAVGTHSLRAVYSGDGNFLASPDATLTQTVAKKETKATLAPLTAVPNTPFNLTATILPVAPGGAGFGPNGERIHPTGSVQFFINGVKRGGLITLNAAGKATLTGLRLAAGTYTIRVQYDGGGTDPNTQDPNFLASNTTFTIRVAGGGSGGTGGR